MKGKRGKGCSYTADEHMTASKKGAAPGGAPMQKRSNGEAKGKKKGS